MRTEFNNSLFWLLIVLFVIVWLLTRHSKSRVLFISCTGFIGALLMPAFVPGHGEFIMMLPNATLFALANKVSWGIGLFYLILNFIIISKIMNRISRTTVT